MRGLRGLRQCAPDDCIWGLRGHESVLQGEGQKKRYDEACRILARVSPYHKPRGGVGRGETPPQWYVGQLYGLAHSVRSNWHPTQISTGHKYCICSRAAYLSGKQRYINYLYMGDPIDTSGWVYWHQIDLLTNEVATYLLGLPDDTNNNGYDADLDTHYGGSAGVGIDRFWNPFDDYYMGHGDAVEPTHPFLVHPQPWGDQLATHNRVPLSVANSQPPYGTRPDCYCIGKRYLSFSGYMNSDSQNEADLYGCLRFDNTITSRIGRWYYTTSSIKGGLTHGLVRPAVRAYMQNEEDEGWWCSYDAATRSIGTGRWRSNTNKLSGSELEHVYPLPTWLQLSPNILHYARMHGRDLFIVRDHADTVIGGASTNKRSNAVLVFDGEQWLTPDISTISCIACDKDGNLYYGGPRVFIKHQDWVYHGTGFYGKTDSTLPPDNVPPEDPQTDPDPPAPPDYLSIAESHYFQIMIGKSRLHIRGFFGQHDLSTVELTSAEWADYEIADRSNSRNDQAIDGDFWSSWTFSKDGTYREPHVQARQPNTPIGDYVRRIVRRQFVARDLSEWYETDLVDSLDRQVLWPKWRASYFPYDIWHGLENFYQWAQHFGNTEGSQLDGFSTTMFGTDFDIADGCDCCCEGNANNY